MTTSIPGIEVADYADAFDSRCPQRKQAAIDLIDGFKVCAQKLLCVMVLAFAKQV